MRESSLWPFSYKKKIASMNASVSELKQFSFGYEDDINKDYDYEIPIFTLTLQRKSSSDFERQRHIVCLYCVSALGFG